MALQIFKTMDVPVMSDPHHASPWVALVETFPNFVEALLFGGELNGNAAFQAHPDLPQQQLHLNSPPVLP